MPRIAADSVHEHVARQEAAVVAAAIELFNERGVRDVNLGDIAKKVGLARNSLYRYFPDKEHILAAWFRMTIGPLVGVSAAIAASSATPSDRIVMWVDAQLTSLITPEHAAMLMASNEMTNLPDDLRAEIGDGHRELYASLGRILDDVAAGASERDLGVVTYLIAALVRSAAEQIRAGADVGVVRVELRRAALAVAGT